MYINPTANLISEITYSFEPFKYLHSINACCPMATINNINQNHLSELIFVVSKTKRKIHKLMTKSSPFTHLLIFFPRVSEILFNSSTMKYCFIVRSIKAKSITNNEIGNVVDCIFEIEYVMNYPLLVCLITNQSIVRPPFELNTIANKNDLPCISCTRLSASFTPP